MKRKENEKEELPLKKKDGKPLNKFTKRESKE